jgi:large subunit ribosomal protein L24e
MVEKRDCSFCGSAMEPGTGMLFIKRDGTRHNFCSAKCRRNLLDLGRVPRTVKWTKHYVKGLGKASAVQSGKKVAKPAKPAAPAAEAPAPAAGGGAAGGGAAPEAAKPAPKPAPKTASKPAPSKAKP